jgi:branched-chain amino acid transport system ATP-binding protein
MALKISDRAYILELGKIALEDKAKNLINNEQIKKLYLGG